MEKANAEMTQNLLFIIDTTGSMNNWIIALKNCLPSFINTAALTGVFDNVGIIGYKDYNVQYEQNLYNWSGWFKFNDCNILNVTANLEPSSGGSTEAMRTALLVMKTVLMPNSETVVMHLYDMPEHANAYNFLNMEGLYEYQQLGHLYHDEALLNNLHSFIINNNSPIRYYALTCCNKSILAPQLAQIYNGKINYIHQIDKVSICNNLITIFNKWCENEVPVLVNRLSNSVNKVKTDDEFANYIYTCLKHCFDNDIMSMCGNSIIGKVWREFCKRRGDQRRGELLAMMDHSKSKLSLLDLKKFEDFNKNSYLNIIEIQEILDNWMNKNEISGLIKYIPDNYLHPHDILKFCQDCKPVNQKQIRDIMTRLIHVKEYTGKTLPNNALPANLPNNMLFKLLLNLAVPGTSVTGRPRAIIAMLALDTVVNDQAVEFLNSIKGNWLNFEVFTEEGIMQGKQMVPENFGINFLNMLLRYSDFLTNEELVKVTDLIKINRLCQISNLELNVEFREEKCLDGCHSDDMTYCLNCNLMIPVSLVDSDQICGYCINGIETLLIPTEWVQVQCTDCYAVYARDKKAYVPGRAICHMCRIDSVYIGASCTIECTNCNVKYINYTNSDPHYKCARCSDGYCIKQQYETTPIPANKLFTDEEFSKIYKSVGVDHPVIINSKNTVIEKCKPETEFYVETNKYNKYTNLTELFKVLLDHASGKRNDYLIECSLCFSTVHKNKIIHACGRSGCKQRVCTDCSSAWYNVLKPGNLIMERRIFCPFCTRKPTHKIINRWCPNARWLTGKIDMNASNYYAWCIRCNQIKNAGEKICSVDLPVLNNWQCDDCHDEIERNSIADKNNSEVFKECSECGIMTERISGCNHIACPCGNHWCFVCRAAFKQSNDCYSHMLAVHGSYQDNEVYSDESDY